MISALMVGSIKGELLMRRCFTHSPKETAHHDDSKKDVRARPYCLGVVHSSQRGGAQTQIASDISVIELDDHGGCAS